MCNVRATYKVTFYVTKNSNHKYMNVWKCKKSNLYWNNTVLKKNENKLNINVWQRFKKLKNFNDAQVRKKLPWEVQCVYSDWKPYTMYFSQIFHMFFKGLQPCLSCSKPNGNFVNNYCQLLNKDIFDQGNFCICFLMTETIITCTWICSLKKLIFILQEL